LARNSCIFEGKNLPSFKVSQQVLALMPLYKDSSNKKKSREMATIEINPNVAWGFFDGSFQEVDKLCGLGFKPQFLGSHYIIGTTNSGVDRNNKG
jgi:hypothetical protein